MAHFKFKNAWSDAAREDPRYRDKPAAAPSDRHRGPDVGELGAGRSPGDQAGRASRPPTRAACTAPSWGTWHAKGSAVGGSRVTAEDVRSIRARHAAGAGPAELARLYGIHRRTVHAIVSRESWRHVP